jgi:hypothetical protein
MRQTAVTVALVGLVLLGVGAQTTAFAVPAPQCFVCICGDVGPPFVTKCSTAPLVDFDSQCPPCTGEFGIRTSQDPCNELPACRPFLSRAPALSHVPLAGLGVLLVIGGVWLTRKRARAAS